MLPDRLWALTLINRGGGIIEALDLKRCFTDDLLVLLGELRDLRVLVVPQLLSRCDLATLVLAYLKLVRTVRFKRLGGHGHRMLH